MKYRDHCGTLKDSMKTVREFSSKKELIDHISDKYDMPCEEISFVYAKFDERVNWNSYYVMASFLDLPKQVMVGISDGELK